ncbi:MAG: hypothetical protein KBT27_03900 [Prevotellaceae bacterium]|nr:hypothetical protein [Candidatus Faecinaster equi]
MKTLKLLFIVTILLSAIVTAFAYILNSHMSSPIISNTRVIYVFNLISIVATFLLVFVALKMFVMKPVTKYICTEDEEKSLKRYININKLRLGSIIIIEFFNLFAFITTLNHTGLWCTIVLIISLFFCNPSRSNFETICNNSKL